MSSALGSCLFAGHRSFRATITSLLKFVSIFMAELGPKGQAFILLPASAAPNLDEVLETTSILITIRHCCLVGARKITARAPDFESDSSPCVIQICCSVSQELQLSNILYRPSPSRSGEPHWEASVSWSVGWQLNSIQDKAMGPAWLGCVKMGIFHALIWRASASCRLERERADEK